MIGTKHYCFGPRERKCHGGKPAARTRAAARKQREEAMRGRDRITILGPHADGTWIVEFRTAARREAGDPNPENRGISD